ncbi:MAG: cardiolipin synthase [Gammaproteobacteria bacterium]
MLSHFVIGVCLFVVAIYSATHALLYKKDSRAAFSWIAVCIFLPLFGPLLYFIFGINRVHKRAQELSTPLFEEISYEKNFTINNELLKQVPDSLGKLQKVSKRITEFPLIGGNNIHSLYSGEQTYSEMLKAINAATEYIYLCVYIFKRDAVGELFVEALIDAKNRGVDVFVLIDGIGELYSWKKVYKTLIKNGVLVRRFLPPKLMPFNFSINLRNHRKILVIDDEIGFVGGMNISEEYYYKDKPEDSLKDIHFKVMGNLPQQFSRVFELDWHFTGGCVRTSAKTKINNSSNPTICRTIMDGPGENLDHLSIILLSAINSANHTITLMTPYFLPSRELIGALQTAVLRGVTITIILPSQNNLNYVHWATRHMLWELLENEVAIHYQPPPFSHSKLFVIDNKYSLIGSANIDPRSLRLNYEVGVEVYDVDFSTKLNSYAESILKTCRLVTLEEVDNRALPVKIRDGVAWLFTPYL